MRMIYTALPPNLDKMGKIDQIGLARRWMNLGYPAESTAWAMIDIAESLRKLVDEIEERAEVREQ